jgi:hypothetical protein
MADANDSSSALAEEANARLRELGYAPEEAHAERRLRGVRLSGDLVPETVVERDRIQPVLAMLPPKPWLLALRHASESLGRREAGRGLD